MKKLFVRLKILKLSIKRIFRLTLGDEVIYKGKRYTLIQGVANPYWDLYSAQKKERLKHIHIKDFKKIISIKNIINDFTFTHHFFMGYWYNIWIRRPYNSMNDSII